MLIGGGGGGGGRGIFYWDCLCKTKSRDLTNACRTVVRECLLHISYFSVA